MKKQCLMALKYDNSSEEDGINNSEKEISM
jgi:hypothetical protein